ncbi:MAG TPA: class I SAM-dependent methyltransferase [Candidatus Kapabacteria bacterium]|nr:class I SAM-dependent methyltransferase [Candidatus Kapabacteria bacterium]
MSTMNDPSVDARDAWNRLAESYESSRVRPNSLDTLVEFPAQIEFIGRVSGKTVLDVGCGSGAKARYFASRGARRVLGVDVSDAFAEMWKAEPPLENLRLVRGDINALKDVPDLAAERFDIILCLQVLGFAIDRAASLKAMSDLLVPDGRIVLQSPSPIRFAVEKSERFAIPFGAAYSSGGSYEYPSGWDPTVILRHQTPLISDMLNAFAEAGLFVARCWEPEMPETARREHPDKAAWWDKYGGVVLYELVRR